MDYTREPIVETIITPKDGYRIAVRNSKNPGQEEFIVEALEVVSFGTNCFFRSLERPRAFMVPASDYEVLEVRETRSALKAATPEGVVKLPSSRDTQRAVSREAERRKPVPQPKEPLPVPMEAEKSHTEAEPMEEAPPVAAPDSRHERRGDRRRSTRRRRGREEIEEREPPVRRSEQAEVPGSPAPEPTSPLAQMAPSDVQAEPSPPVLSTLLPPPPTLIRDDIERYRRNERYKGAFYIREPEGEGQKPVAEEPPAIPLHLREEEPPVPSTEENIYRATPAPLEE